MKRPEFWAFMQGISPADQPCLQARWIFWNHLTRGVETSSQSDFSYSWPAWGLKRLGPFPRVSHSLSYPIMHDSESLQVPQNYFLHSAQETTCRIILSGNSLYGEVLRLFYVWFVRGSWFKKREKGKKSQRQWYHITKRLGWKRKYSFQ